MKSLVTDIRLQFNAEHQPELVLALSLSPQQAQEGVAELKEVLGKGKKLQAEIKQYRKKRSLDANSYCWVLCQKLAEKLNSTKEDIYKEAIRKAGQFDFIAVTDSAADQFLKAWQSKGLGWYAEALESKIEGCKKIMVYYGSSVYDSKEMAHLIEYIISECKELGIETMTPTEISRMMNEWGKANV